MPAQPAPLDPTSYDNIIFDLGGVLLPLDFGRTVEQLGLVLRGDARALYTQVKQATVFDQLERGEIEAETFRRAVLESAHLTPTPELNQSLDDAFNAMLGTLPREHLAFLKKLKQEKRTFLLSNTNEIHLSRFLDDYEREHLGEHGPWDALFHQAHYSHLLGMRKPELRIFEALLTRHDLEPGRTLFLDDNEDNIRAAREVGLLAVHHPTNAPLLPRFVL